MQFVHSLKRGRRYGLLWSLTKAVTLPLATHLCSNSLYWWCTDSIALSRRWMILRAVEMLLLGYQSEPDVFHDCLPPINAFIDSLNVSLTSSLLSSNSNNNKQQNSSLAPPPLLMDTARLLLRVSQ